MDMLKCETLIFIDWKTLHYIKKNETNKQLITHSCQDEMFVKGYIYFYNIWIDLDFQTSLVYVFTLYIVHMTCYILAKISFLNKYEVIV